MDDLRQLKKDFYAALAHGVRKIFAPITLRHKSSARAISQKTGEGFEDALEITNAWTRSELAAAEYDWLAERFGPMHFSWRLVSHCLMVKDGKFCERVWIQLKNLEHHVVFFDVTDFIEKSIANAPRETFTIRDIYTKYRNYPYVRLIRYSGIFAVGIAFGKALSSSEVNMAEARSAVMMLVWASVAMCYLLAYREQVGEKGDKVERWIKENLTPIRLWQRISAAWRAKSTASSP